MISVLYNIILITNFKLIEMCRKSSPRREGRDHRGYPYFAACVLIGTLTHPDTPMANHQHLTPITQHPSLAVTLCDICMPEAFCEFETVRKKVLLNL